jgi:hypothetical protein
LKRLKMDGETWTAIGSIATAITAVISFAAVVTDSPQSLRYASNHPTIHSIKPPVSGDFDGHEDFAPRPAE